MAEPLDRVVTVVTRWRETCSSSAASAGRVRLPEPLQPLPGGEPGAIGGAGAGAPARPGRRAAAWSNGPGDRTPRTSTATTKLLVCAEGSIIFLVGADAVPVELTAGEGFVLPAGTRHAAPVGPHGLHLPRGPPPLGALAPRRRLARLTSNRLSRYQRLPPRRAPRDAAR